MADAKLNLREFAILRYFYAADLLFKLYCVANYMRKVPEVLED